MLSCMCVGIYSHLDDTVKLIGNINVITLYLQV